LGGRFDVSPAGRRIDHFLVKENDPADPVLPEIAEDRTALLEAGPAETHEQELAELVAEGGHGKEGSGRQRD